MFDIGAPGEGQHGDGFYAGIDDPVIACGMEIVLD